MPNTSAPPLSGDSEEQDDRRIRQVVDIYLRSHPPIPDFDRDDLYQEGRRAWLKAEGSHRANGGASRPTYIGRVVKYRLTDLARRASAQQRGGGQRPLSLDVPVTDDGSTLAELLADDAPTPQEEVELAELVSLVSDLRKRLTDRQRRFADGLSEGQSVSRIARDLGVSRDTLYDERDRIKKVFRDEGLADFFR